MGQTKRIILNVFAHGRGGFRRGTYLEFAEHLTKRGYPTTKENIADAKWSKRSLEKLERTVPADAEGIRELLAAVVEVEPEFGA